MLKSEKYREIFIVPGLDVLAVHEISESELQGLQCSEFVCVVQPETGKYRLWNPFLIPVFSVDMTFLGCLWSTK